MEVRNGTLVSSEGFGIEKTNALFVTSLVEGIVPAGVNPVQTISFIPFDTLNVGGWAESGFLVADFANGQVVVNELVPLFEGSFVRHPASVSEGQQIHFRPVVRLNRSVWNPNGTLSNVVWNPKVLGADPSRYNPSHNIDIARSFTIPVNSENLAVLEEFEDLDFSVGGLQAHRRKGVNTVMIPWSPEFLDDQHNPLVESITAALYNTSVPVFTGTRSASAVDYMSVGEIKDWDPDFPYYMNTLVMFNGEMHVATGSGLPVPFTPSATLLSVALETDFLEGLQLEVIRDYIGNITSAKISNRQEREPQLSFHRRNYENLRMAISSGLPVSLGNRMYAEFQYATGYHDTMLRAFNLQDVRRNVGMMGWVVVTIALFFSVSIVLVRGLYRAGPIQVVSTALLDFTGFDILAILTLRVIRTGEDPPGWLPTVALASAVCAIPLVIIGLFAANGISIL
jgi:hypothetical protein